MMKQNLFKGLLFSSILAAGLVATPVFAATGNGAGTKDNNISSGTATQGFEANTTTNASANSVGEFTIDAGKLTLDKVPNLHFTKDAAGKTNANIADVSKGITLKLANATITPNAVISANTFDGNSALAMTVSDFRGDDQNGWKVMAAATPFQKDTNHQLTGTTINLKADVVDREAGVAGTNIAAPSAVVIPATGAAQIVAQSGKGTGQFTNNFTFGTDTEMTIPAQVAQAGLYQAQLSWTLANVPTAGN